MRAQKPKMLRLTERPSPVILRFKRTARSWEAVQNVTSNIYERNANGHRCYPSSDPTNSVTVYP